MRVLYFSWAFCRLLLLGVLCVLSACTKFETTTIGGDLVSEFPNMLELKDTTIEVTAQTFLSADPDTSKVLFFYGASGQSILKFAVGQYSDVHFGSKQLSLFFSLFPPDTATNPLVGDGFTLDSVRLFLQSYSVYGDTLSPSTLHVYPLTEVMKSKVNNDYYQYAQGVAYDNANVLASMTINKQSFQTDNSSNQLMLALPNSFGESFLSADASVWTSADAFKNFFKGLAIIPSSSNQANTLFNLSIDDTGTYIALYYQSNESGTVSQKVLKLSLHTVASGVANQITWDQSGSDIHKYVTTDASSDQDYVFLQTNYGSYIIIDHTKVLNLDSNIMIHRAELIATERYEKTNVNSTVLAPQYAFLISQTDAGQSLYEAIPKDGSFGTIRIDTVDALKQPIAQYKFLVTRYIQSLVNHTGVYYPFMLNALNFSVLLNNNVYVNQRANGHVRLVGGGNKSTPSDRMHLRILYSVPKR